MASQQIIQQQVAVVDGILYKLRCYRDPQRVRIDVLELIRNFPSLQARSGSLAQGGVQQNQIIYVAGTIPIFYNGVQYNIPVAIWVVEGYPFAPPVCYVTPTSDMIIKPRHRNVDTAGMCYLPYLSSWNPTNCNLVNLASILSQTFGEDPPVRSSATKSAQPAQSQQQQPQQQPQSSYPGSQYGQQPSPIPQPQQGYPQQGSYPQNNQQNYASPVPTGYPNHQQQQKPLPSGQAFEDPAIVAKRNAVRSVTEKTQMKMQSFFAGTTREIDAGIAESARLDERSKSLEAERIKLDTNQARAATDINNLTKSFDDITKWLDANDSSKVEVDIDAVTEPKDPLSKQLLYLVAEDATIEDTLYFLEKNLMNGELALDIFLKNVRALATEQFLKRAQIKKVHERQRSQMAK